MHASNTTRPLAAFTDEQLLEFADTWRRMARVWTRMANGGDLTPRLAARFRRSAQTALYAAYEAEETFKARLRAADETSGPPSTIAHGEMPARHPPRAMPAAAQGRRRTSRHRT